MLAMRSSRPENLETAIMSDKMVRSAVSRTDSDSAWPASLVILSTVQGARLTIMPIARSRVRRRQVSTDCADLGVSGPPVRRRFRHVVVSRPGSDRYALRNRKGELSFVWLRDALRP